MIRKSRIVNGISPATKNILRTILKIVKWPSNKINYLHKYFSYKKMSEKSERFPARWRHRYPCYGDDEKGTSFDAHYIYHPAWAARIIADNNSEVHVDISSSLHFCSIVSAFTPVQFYDYRPAQLNLSNLDSGFADLTSLPFASNSVKSLSCMHTIEHVGLGRYGDPIDPNGDIIAINELKRVLADDGDLLFVVPVGGVATLMFDAHRIYTYEMIADYFSDLSLMEFSLVSDKSETPCFITNASKADADDCKYGCGCFWFKKNLL